MPAKPKLPHAKIKVLLQAWNQGDESALNQLVDILLKPRLIPGAIHLIKKYPDQSIQPEELLNAAWMRWRRRKKRDLDDPEKLITWMLLEAGLELLDQIKANRKSERTISIDQIFAEETNA